MGSSTGNHQSFSSDGNGIMEPVFMISSTVESRPVGGMTPDSMGTAVVCVRLCRLARSKIRLIKALHDNARGSEVAVPETFRRFRQFLPISQLTARILSRHTFPRNDRVTRAAFISDGTLSFVQRAVHLQDLAARPKRLAIM